MNTATDVMTHEDFTQWLYKKEPQDSMYESKILPKWVTPDSYFGFDPVGDYVLYARNRDSQILTESNWECLEESLEKVIKELPSEIQPSIRYTEKWGDKEELPSEWMYVWSASHWAVGWVEYMMIRADAPLPVIKEAEELYTALHDYCILDEDDYGRKQDDAIYQFWKDCSLEERMEYCRQAGDSIFSARRDDEIPPDVYDDLRDMDMFN